MVTADQLAEQVSAEVDAEVDASQILPLIAFLRENELLAPVAEVRDFLRQKRLKNTPGLWGWLLHNYLFFRMPLLRPEPMLDWLVAHTRWIYSKGMLWFMLLLAVIDIHLIFQHSSELAAHFDYSFSMDGLLLIGAAGIFSKIFHEFGHAITARRYGVRVPAIGVAFVVMYPMLYTDTSDSWRLNNKNQRLAIASAGMISEFSLALFATFLWAITPDGTLRSALFSLAFIGWVIALGLNASPFFRFDGYYVLSDATDIQNLHERAGALARQRLRQFFLGIEDPDPEPYLGSTSKRALIAFAICTWFYRLIVFITIALLVYNYFFKLLGIVLMVVELVWFVGLPIYKEVAALKQRFSELRPSWGALVMLVLLSIVAGWLWTLANAITSPAVLSAKDEYRIQTPETGLLIRLNLANGQTVKTGDELAVIVSPEFLLRHQTAGISRSALVEELQRTAANASSRERIGAIQSQISQLLASEKLSSSQSELLRLRTPGNGTVRDVLPDAVPGRWVKPRETLARVVSERDGVITAYVSEATLRWIHVGARATFYPENSAFDSIAAKVVEVDTAATRSLPSPVLASVFGGALPTSRTESGELILHDARYRVRLKPDLPVVASQVQSGTVSIEGDGLSALVQIPSRITSALIREFGF
jgi:putative peptide zinc metalloprotease protein